MNCKTIKEMRHAIGLDYKDPKRGKYEAYRNYAQYNTPHPIWEELIKDGLASCRQEESSRNSSGYSYWYNLTRAGLDLMEVMIGAKITERKEPTNMAITKEQRDELRKERELGRNAEYEQAGIWQIVTLLLNEYDALEAELVKANRCIAGDEKWRSRAEERFAEVIANLYRYKARCEALERAIRGDCAYCIGTGCKTLGGQHMPCACINGNAWQFDEAKFVKGGDSV